uniref:Uncharacterized protein ycf33 n=1 Tax=Gracilaria tenuistipitata var. liui TaxID=285951 RepID=Q6B8Z1_GRATL|nr:conserved hypothetical plastid protein [Gracilaria tenuistipitata var. liui]AAT79644.1 conserved hypothetical plastid protein [Gracilaria tenuistipitata var. liui]
MNKFWHNLRKFPKFLLSVIAGFFLTTFYTIFELLKEKNKRLTITIIMILIIDIIIMILKRMLDIN